MVTHSSILAFENPVERGAWWAPVHGVTQSGTWLKRFGMYALEKEVATHSNILAWRIPETEEPGGLLYMGSHRVGHDWSNLAAATIFHCVYVPQLSYPFICQWTSRLLLCPRYCKHWAARLLISQLTYMLFAVWSQIFKTRSFLCQMINWLEQYCQAWNMMLPKPEESYWELFFASFRSSKMQLLTLYFERGCSGMQ